MANYSANQLKNGLKVMIDGDPCAIMDLDFVKPGKGQAFTRAKMRNLLTGRVWERTFKSNESVEGADVMDRDMEYLYFDGEMYNFMVPVTFEQYAVDKSAIGEAYKWMKENETCMVTLWNDNPISVLPPNFVELEVTETDPGLKGDTDRKSVV